MGREPWQLRFDGGHQQRYFETRHALAECVLRVARQSPDRRFEVWGEAAATARVDASGGGRTFQLLEVLDLDDPQTAARLASELVDSGSDHDGSARTASPLLQGHSPGAGADPAGPA